MDNFIIKDKYSFKLYPLIKEVVILEALIEEVKLYNLPKEIIPVLEEAWNSRFCEVSGYDGATIIKNKKHPAICNFLHDYFYRCGFAGKIADDIYKELLLRTGYTKATAIYRYSTIRVFSFYFRVKHRHFRSYFI